MSDSRPPGAAAAGRGRIAAVHRRRGRAAFPCAASGITLPPKESPPLSNHDGADDLPVCRVRASLVKAAVSQARLRLRPGGDHRGGSVFDSAWPSSRLRPPRPRPGPIPQCSRKDTVSASTGLVGFVECTRCRARLTASLWPSRRPPRSADRLPDGSTAVRPSPIAYSTHEVSCPGRALRTGGASAAVGPCGAGRSRRTDSKCGATV
jgi:hypothetical protein